MKNNETMQEKVALLLEVKKNGVINLSLEELINLKEALDSIREFFRQVQIAHNERFVLSEEGHKLQSELEEKDEDYIANKAVLQSYSNELSALAEQLKGFCTDIKNALSNNVSFTDFSSMYKSFFQDYERTLNLRYTSLGTMEKLDSLASLYDILQKKCDDKEAALIPAGSKLSTFFYKFYHRKELAKESQDIESIRSLLAKYSKPISDLKDTRFRQKQAYSKQEDITNRIQFHREQLADEHMNKLFKRTGISVPDVVHDSKNNEFGPTSNIEDRWFASTSPLKSAMVALNEDSSLDILLDSAIKSAQDLRDFEVEEIVEFGAHTDEETEI